jgi:hypothetical protein
LRGRFDWRVLMRRPSVIDRYIPRDSQQPGGEFRKVAAIPVAVAPGLLERPGSEIFGQGFVAQPIAQKVVNPR